MNAAMRAVKIVRAPSMKNSLPKSNHMELVVRGEEGNIPSPCSVSKYTFHAIKDPGSDQRSKGITYQNTAGKDGGS